jgi:alpha-beta hydrolase superfamily lysophospholipase
MADGAPGSCGCEYSTGWFTSPRGPRLATHAWQPVAPAGADAAAGAPHERACRVFLLHGYGAHGMFPTVRLLAEYLASHGYRAHSFDFEGAGDSEGLQGLINDTADQCTDALAFVAATARGAPCFLAGTSMGGGMALICANAAADAGVRNIVGCVLLAPLVVIAEAAKPSAPVRAVLTALGSLIPWAPLVGGSSSDGSAQYRDPSQRALCENDPKAYKGKMRLATARALLDLGCVRATRVRPRVRPRAPHATAVFLPSRRIGPNACAAPPMRPHPLPSAQCHAGGAAGPRAHALPGAARHRGHGGGREQLAAPARSEPFDRQDAHRAA